MLGGQLLWRLDDRVEVCLHEFVDGVHRGELLGRGQGLYGEQGDDLRAGGGGE
jgi:hypothetical protein